MDLLSLIKTFAGDKGEEPKDDKTKKEVVNMTIQEKKEWIKEDITKTEKEIITKIKQDAKDTKNSIKKMSDKDIESAYRTAQMINKLNNVVSDLHDIVHPEHKGGE